MADFTGPLKKVLSSVALAVLGSTAYTQMPLEPEGAESLFDLYFCKGINISYIFGNNTHNWVIDPLVVNGALGYTYSPDRLNHLLIDVDFQNLSDKGFKCVRLPIDPMIFGCTTADPTVKNTGVFQANFDALISTIGEANAKIFR